MAAGSNDFQPDRIAALVHWITERESIRRKKAAGLPRPYTSDPVLHDSRFCNVARRDDYVTRWLFAHWYGKDLAERSPGHVLARAGMARLVNEPDTLRGLAGKRFTKSQALAHFDWVESQGKVFNGAYKVNPGPESRTIVFVLWQIEQLRDLGPALLLPYSMQATWERLQSIEGIGSFIAGQMVADLRHVYPGEWADRHDWAPMGPGSRKGIAWLLGWDGRAKLPKMQQAEFLRLLRLLLAELKQHDSFLQVFEDRRLEMHDLQNVLCETDKWLRVRTGTGNAKARYVPRTQTKRPALGGPAAGFRPRAMPVPHSLLTRRR